MLMCLSIYFSILTKKAYLYWFKNYSSLFSFNSYVVSVFSSSFSSHISLKLSMMTFLCHSNSPPLSSSTLSDYSMSSLSTFSVRNWSVKKALYSHWLLILKNIFCIHFLRYFLEVGLNYNCVFILLKSQIGYSFLLLSIRNELIYCKSVKSWHWCAQGESKCLIQLNDIDVT